MWSCNSAYPHPFRDTVLIGYFRVSVAPDLNGPRKVKTGSGMENTNLNGGDCLYSDKVVAFRLAAGFTDKALRGFPQNESITKGLASASHKVLNSNAESLRVGAWRPVDEGWEARCYRTSQSMGRLLASTEVAKAIPEIEFVRWASPVEMEKIGYATGRCAVWRVIK